MKHLSQSEAQQAGRHLNAVLDVVVERGFHDAPMSLIA
jgi:hypothetical protein